MRNYEERLEILSLWEDGHNHSEIARMVNIPRSTVRDIINKFQNVDELGIWREERKWLISPEDWEYDLNQPQEYHLHYARLLGLYLGDGYISKEPRTYKLRVFLDMKYPFVIERCKESISVVFPNNKVGIVNCTGCVAVYVYNNNLPLFFPQHGPGTKHSRNIKLKPWQESIVFSKEGSKHLLQGFFDSDGSRYIANQGKYKPVRYGFANLSEDIKDIFCKACDIHGLSYSRTHGRKDVLIQAKKHVLTLDSFIKHKLQH